ncbi:MAG: glycosyltransferase family 4 protein, partial [Bryobacteraceae bacterium]
PSLDILGGQSIQAAMLLAHLRKEPGIEVDFLAVNPRLPGPLRGLQRIKYIRTLATETAYLGALLVCLPQHNVIHAFSAAYWSFLLAPAPALLLARLLRKKTILNYHDGRLEDHLRNFPRAIRLMRVADRIVIPSQFLVDAFARFGLCARSIPNIVDIAEFRYRERARPCPVFLHNRAMEPLYNVPCSLRAFGIVQAKYPGAHLMLAHDGPLRPQLEAMVRELALHNVEFLGPVSQQRMAELHNEAGIYITSPDVDNMPGSVLECFASGLPVIATRAGGISYMVEHERTGLLVPLDDHRAMAAAAMRLLEEDGLARRLGGNALRECDRYRGPLVASQWADLYRELSSAAPS